MRGKSVRLLASIPEKYSPDFLERLDKRTVLGRAVLDRYESVVSDLGGDDALSTVKHSLVRRFVWFEVMIEGVECRAAAGEGVDVGTWTQLVNSWLGVARLLGLDRRAKDASGLKDRLNARRSAARPPVTLAATSPAPGGAGVP